MSEESSETKCPICWVDMTTTEDIFTQPLCFHKFHAMCFTEYCAFKGLHECDAPCPQCKVKSSEVLSDPAMLVPYFEDAQRRTRTLEAFFPSTQRQNTFEDQTPVVVADDSDQGGSMEGSMEESVGKVGKGKGGKAAKAKVATKQKPKVATKKVVSKSNKQQHRPILR